MSLIQTLQRHRDALEAIRWPAGWARTVQAPSGAPNPALPRHDVLR